MMQETRSPRRPRASLLAALLLVLGACESSGSAGPCPEPGSCGESPIGSWTRMPCGTFSSFIYTESVTSGGQTTTTTCVLNLDDVDIVTTGSLDVEAGGRYVLVSRASGTWSGLVEPGCVEPLGTTCAELSVFDNQGATGCAETAEGCRCDGAYDRNDDSTGDWQIGSGSISFTSDDDNSTVSGSYCSDGIFLRIGDGDAKRLYRAK